MDVYQNIMEKISNGDLQGVKRYFLDCPINTNGTNSLGQTYLMAASECGSTDIINFLIDARADLEMSDVNGNTALHYAVRCRQIYALEVLISRGSDVNWENNYGMAPLNFATLMRNEWPDGVATLLETRGKNIIKVNQRNNEGFAPLHYACALGHKDTVRLLLSHNDIDANANGREGNTPLHLAVLNQRSDVVTLMASQDSVKLESENHIGMTPLLEAVSLGHLGMMFTLIDKGAKINAVNNEGNNCLHLALKRDIFHSEVEYMGVLDKYSFKLSLKKKDRLSSRVVASYLSDLGANLHHPNGEDVTPLDLIDNPNLKEKVKALLRPQCTYCEANAPSKFTPCGHTLLCHDCYINIACEKCPTCKQRIEGSEPQMSRGDVLKTSQQVDTPMLGTFRKMSQSEPSTSQPERSTSQPMLSTSQSMPSTPQPKRSTSQPKRSTSQPIPSTSQPMPSTSQPEPFTSQSERSTSQPMPSTSQSMSSTSQPKRSTSQPIPSTSQPKPSTSQPKRTTSQPIPSTSQPEPFTSQSERSTSQSMLSTSQPERCTSEPDGIFLGVKSVKLGHIRHDFSGNVQEQSFQMLLYWSTYCDPQEFTVDTLRAALEDAESFAALKCLSLQEK
ncbi:E3 ubiquitin-protein ligase MIB2 isoform X2 [Octopus sinensis]|uniref:E3 ubiquitin-protein ligase MIB2 isoform X2 n=1 Tax=Octopus sinensis TaxID=2607531 RepID=A0A7E6FRF9_9MOLL|nr:E3 ubiquitin-protein ligase MIB2 isoform X2 [Octopus sinensis]